MAEKIVKLGIKREPGFLYFLRGSDVWRTPMKRAGSPSARGIATCIVHGNFKREDGYLYFVDAHGDISRAKEVKKSQQRKPQKTKTVKSDNVLDETRKTDSAPSNATALTTEKKLPAVEKLSVPATEKTPAHVKRPQRHSLRKLIDKILLDDPLLNAFCCDFFPDIYKSFTQGMNRLEKITLLLTRVESTEEILDNLRLFDEVSVLEHENILKYE